MPRTTSSGGQEDMRAALLLIDLQKHFLAENREAFDRKIIPHMKELLSIARKQGMTIIHIITKYRRDKSDWPEAFKERDVIWCLEGSDESGIIEGLGPIGEERLIIKKRFTAFFHTELNRILRDSMVDTLCIGGYAADGCVRYTTMDAYNEGYSIIWLRDCMDSAWEDFRSSLEYMKRLTRLKDLSNEEFYALMPRLR
jgi:nicotinamidase-related amidase